MQPSPSIGSPIIDFSPFRLDLRAGQLSRDGVSVPLRPKTFAVLQQLAEHPGELLTKRALLDAVWGDLAVSEDVVRLSVGELRSALGDAPREPRFIQTVPRRGYRFIAKMAAGERATAAEAGEYDFDFLARAATVVGRSNERAAVAGWLDEAIEGGRRIGFVTGEAGIGKTTLVDTVLADLRRLHGPRLRIARGQCVEHYGGGEPYLPLLDALASLHRGSDRPRVDQSLRLHAPRWLLRALGIRDGDLPADGSAPGTHEHTLLSLADSLHALAADAPLVLALEDVHWCDYSTVEVLSILAQRRDLAGLLVICTLRPADAIVHGHPIAGLKREMLRKGLCWEILLDGLAPADLSRYLAARFPGARLPDDLHPLVVDRSEGNPFFVVALIDHLIEQQLLVENGAWELRGEFETLRTTIPDGLHAVVEPRLERLAPQEMEVLQAASVAGLDFDARIIAAVAAGNDVEQVERVCDSLLRRQEFLQAAVVGVHRSPDAVARYKFSHGLYRQVIYERLSPAARRRLHQAVGETLERTRGAGNRDAAAELAAHFERSGDDERAVRYYGEAAAHASSRFSYEETRNHLERALRLLRSQPRNPPRLRREMELLETLGWTLFALRGFGDEGAARAFARVRDIAESLGEAAARLRAMQSILTVRTMRAEHGIARELGEEMIAVAEGVGDAAAADEARPTVGAALIHLGELEAAHAEAERCLDASAGKSPTIGGVSAGLLLGSTCAHFGLAARARTVTKSAVARADQLGIPYVRAHATVFVATIHQVLRDVAETRRFADEAMRLAAENSFSVFRIMANLYTGWCDVQEGRLEDGLATVREALQQYAGSGQRISTSSYTLLLAEAYLANGDAAAADRTLDRALAFAAETGERLYEHELYRLKGECRLANTDRSGHETEAIELFERAVAIAAERKALLFELRATTSLFRLTGSARDRLVALVDRFAVEDDCADLRGARHLLDR